jgi:hypothetical protein
MGWLWPKVHLGRDPRAQLVVVRPDADEVSGVSYSCVMRMTITRGAVVSQEGMALRHAHDDYKKNL